MHLVAEFQRRHRATALLVTCKQGELEAALQADTTLADLDIDKWDVALSSALLYLDANEVLHLARGKAVFRSAMNIELKAEARRRQFKKSDYTELALHYKDKTVQVHVMVSTPSLRSARSRRRWPSSSITSASTAPTSCAATSPGARTCWRWRPPGGAPPHPHRARQPRAAGHRRRAARGQPPLVLAGPGAGKTRVIVHRVAWLLRESMVQPDAIMVLAYNRAAANEIRRRLWALVGTDAAGVTVQTLHGLAMRLTAHQLRGRDRARGGGGHRCRHT